MQIIAKSHISIIQKGFSPADKFESPSNLVKSLYDGPESVDLLNTGVGGRYSKKTLSKATFIKRKVLFKVNFKCN